MITSKESSSSAATINRSAELFIEARRSGRKLERLPPEAMPATADEAFGVQLKVAELLGQKIGGYKVSGATGTRLAGIILADSVFQSPASLPRKAGLRVETEIAVVIGSEGPAETGSSIDGNEVRGLVSAISAGIEILESRYIGQGRLLTSMERHADLLSSGGYVLGPRQENWDRIELTSRPMKFWAGERLLYDEALTHPHKDPFESIAWLANYLPAFGLRLEPGQFVTTGSYSGAHMVIPGDIMKVEFPDVGTAEVGIGVSGHWGNV